MEDPINGGLKSYHGLSICAQVYDLERSQMQYMYTVPSKKIRGHLKMIGWYFTKLKSLDGIKPNTNPKTNLNPNTNPNPIQLSTVP